MEDHVIGLGWLGFLTNIFDGAYFESEDFSMGLGGGRAVDNISKYLPVGILAMLGMMGLVAIISRGK